MDASEFENCKKARIVDHGARSSEAYDLFDRWIDRQLQRLESEWRDRAAPAARRIRWDHGSRF